MRTRIQTVFDAPNLCEVVIPEGDGKVVHTTYWAPSGGGYVRDVTTQPGTLGRQVCEGLSYMGNTLLWAPSHGPLVKLIRREYHAERQCERRRMARIY